MRCHTSYIHFQNKSINNLSSFVWEFERFCSRASILFIFIRVVTHFKFKFQEKERN